MAASAAEACTFCSILAGQRPGVVIDEDATTAVLLSLENHPLVIPRAHIQDLWSLDDETAAAVARKAIRVAHALRDALACDGVYVTQTNGACAGQSVFHYHMHLYPRWNDGEAKHRVQPKARLAEQIRAVLKR